MSKRIMLIGEPMGLFIAEQEGALENVSSFKTAIAGAEYNVAVGLSRLGHFTGYITKIGKDPFGKKIMKGLRENNIDESLVIFSDDKVTGSMMKSKVSKGDPEIYYYRKNSAASFLSCDDIEKLDFSKYSILHLTGIFPALSELTLETTRFLIKKAKENNITIFFDPNLRPQLWKSTNYMTKTINDLAYESDYFLPGVKEGNILMGSSNAKEIANYYLSHGVKFVVVKTGENGAYGAWNGGSIDVPAFKPEKIVDTVGAGDGFAVGLLSAINEGLSLKEAIYRGNAIGAIQLQNSGDNEGLPTKKELSDFISKKRG